MRLLKSPYLPIIALILMITALYWQFFLLGKIPIPADLLAGAYFPWLDYKWGFAVGVPVKNPLISDVFSQFFIWKYLAVDFLRSGQLPLWNSFSYSGLPLLATYYSATLQPFNLLLLLPKYWGWGLFIFGQTFLAALGMYLFLGTYTKKAAPRLAGSLVFSLSGLMTTWLEYGTGVWAAAMLPWIFFSIESFWQSNRIRFLPLLAFSFAALYLSGHTQLTQYISLLFPIYLSYKLFSHQIKRSQLVLPLLAWVFSLGLVAVQILPTLDYVGSTIRNSDVPILGAAHDGLNLWTDTVRLFAADFFGNPVTYNFRGPGSYHEQASFLGTITLPFILALCFKRRHSSATLFWGGVLLVTILFSFQNPFANWLYSQKIPLLTYSNASRVFFVSSFATGVLLTQSLDRFWDQKIKRGLLIKFNLLLLGVLLFFLFWFFPEILKVRSLTDLTSQLLANPQLLTTLRNIFIPVSLLSISTLLFWRVKNRRLLVLTIIILLYFDLGRYFLKYNAFVSQKLIFPSTPIISFLQNQPAPFRIARADPEVFPPNTWAYYKIESVEGYDAMVSEDYARFFNIVNGQPYQSIINRYSDLHRLPVNFLSALNVKYLITVKRDRKGAIPGEIIDPLLLSQGYKVVFTDKSTVVLQNPAALARAYFVEKVSPFADHQKLIAALENKAFDPRQEALVETSQTFPAFSADAKVEIDGYSSGEMILKTSTTAPSFLVISNPYTKDWQIFRDGRQDRLYKVNGALMGVPVAPGNHVYQLKYRPASVKTGLRLTLTSFLAGIGLIGYSIKKGRW